MDCSLPQNRYYEAEAVRELETLAQQCAIYFGLAISSYLKSWRAVSHSIPSPRSSMRLMPKVTDSCLLVSLAPDA